MTTRYRKIFMYGALSGVVLASSAMLSHIAVPDSFTTDAKAQTATSAKLKFNEKGEAEVPKGYRTWVHAYTAWEPITTSLLDEKTTSIPEFHNVYVEPLTYRAFMETGKWPEGSLLVKEFSFTSTDKENCDGPPAFVCNAWFGKVIFQHGYSGVAVMLKDTKRFPDDAGGWAYFSYGHQQPPYQKTSAKHEKARCAQCHIDHAGAKQDYVFSINQPGLSREGDDAKNNLEAAFPN